MKFNPDIIKSDRRTVSIEVRPDGKVTLHVPKRMTYREIEKLIEEKSPWIEKTIAKYNSALGDEIVPYTDEELDEMTAIAKQIIPPRVEYYAKLMDVTYGKITIRHPKTRWGSCTSKGNLSFNCLLTQVPPEILDSVVVHELSHRREMNHSERFYAQILNVMPDYHERDRWLRQNGMKLMARIRKTTEEKEER